MKGCSDFAAGFTAAILAVAAAAKFRGKGSVVLFLVTLGLPRSLSSRIGQLVVPAELTIAAGLILAAGVAIAIIAVIAAATFSTLQILAVRRHTSVPCHCFGEATAGLPHGGLTRALLLLVSSVVLLVATAATDMSAVVGRGVPLDVGLGSLVGAVALAALALADKIWDLNRRRPRFVAEAWQSAPSGRRGA